MVKCLNIGKVSVNRYIGRSLVMITVSVVRDISHTLHRRLDCFCFADLSDIHTSTELLNKPRDEV